MPASPPFLEIRIHLTNGRVEKFIQDDPQTIAAVLGGLQPSKLFAQPHLFIAGRYSMTAYAASSICMIELVSDSFPEMPFPQGIKDICEITKDEFWERYRPGEDERFERERPRMVGEEMVSYSEIEMVSGEEVYAEVHTTVASHLDRLHAIRQLLAGPVLHARLREGGMAFINPANIARFGIHPGPPETPRTAWPAHHKPER